MITQIVIVAPDCGGRWDSGKHAYQRDWRFLKASEAYGRGGLGERGRGIGPDGRLANDGKRFSSDGRFIRICFSERR